MGRFVQPLWTLEDGLCLTVGCFAIHLSYCAMPKRSIPSRAIRLRQLALPILILHLPIIN